jgi:membrane protein
MRAEKRPDAQMPVRQRSTPKSSKFLRMLGGLTPWQLSRNVYQEIQANSFLGRASELAFDFLFALFPMILLMVTLFSLSSSRSAELQRDMLAFFADFLPRAAFHLLKATTTELAANAGGGGLTFGVVFSLWFASGGVRSMISALNLAYRVREERSWLKVRAIALGLTLLISILLFTALFLVLVSGHVVDRLGAILRVEPEVILIWKSIQWPAAIIFVVLSYALIYYFGPNSSEREWRWVTPGSTFGVLLWFAASIGFRIYLHFLNTYSTSYGSLGAVMILMVWLYVTGLAFLIGGAINAEIERAATP